MKDMNNMINKLDVIDLELLKILANNADISAVEISKRVCLSVPAINKRIAKLKRDGYIKGVYAELDGKKIDKGLICFVFVLLKESKYISDLLEYIKQESDVLECHAVSGEYDFILKICAKDIDEFEDKLLRLKSSQGISKSFTVMSLRTYKKSRISI